MHKKLVFILAVICVLAFVGSAPAGPPAGTKWMITYDGYLEKLTDPGGITTMSADTLIVVNNSHPAAGMAALIDVFDKKGNKVNDTPLGLLNGGAIWPNNIIPADAYGWITLGMIVARDTADPWGFPGAEKFSFRIYTNPSTPPVVEVKQVIYSGPTEKPPGELIWQTQYFRTWCETSLGGLNGTGVVLKK
ncbi:MAG: hypothetical protein HWN68_00490 [Desulfobacterales bacterium]|nr:hypothetical protein [Desulfobacterales bacterium]